MNQAARDWNLRSPLRLTVDEFFRIADAGAFERFTRTELIEGEVLTMNSQWVPHSRATIGLGLELTLAIEALGLDLLTLIGPSVKIEPDSAPEPDVVVTRPTSDKAVPVSAVVLAVEVSASTLDFDLGRKAKLYARAGIPEYWVADIDQRVTRQFWNPAGEIYSQQRVIAFGQTIEAATIAGLIVPTTRLV